VKETTCVIRVSWDSLLERGYLSSLWLALARRQERFRESLIIRIHLFRVAISPGVSSDFWDSAGVRHPMAGKHATRAGVWDFVYHLFHCQSMDTADSCGKHVHPAWSLAVVAFGSMAPQSPGMEWAGFKTRRRKWRTDLTDRVEWDGTWESCGCDCECCPFWPRCRWEGRNDRMFCRN
jgi:hypothetical protein